MKTMKLGAAAVLVSSLFGGAIANAAPVHGAYAPPSYAPGYSVPAPQGPQYREPGYVPPHEARPIETVVSERWQHEQWERFNRGERTREANENYRLSQERADFVARFGWDGNRMAWFDQHQADERAQFNREESARRAAFENQVACEDNDRGPRHGNGYGYGRG